MEVKTAGVFFQSWVAGFGYVSFQRLFFRIVLKVFSYDHPDIVEFEALASVDASNLVEATRVVGPFEPLGNSGRQVEPFFCLPGHGKILYHYIFNQFSIGSRIGPAPAKAGNEACGVRFLRFIGF
jgi:hypothetical protein